MHAGALVLAALTIVLNLPTSPGFHTPRRSPGGAQAWAKGRSHSLLWPPRGDPPHPACAVSSEGLPGPGSLRQKGPELLRGGSGKPHAIAVVPRIQHQFFGVPCMSPGALASGVAGPELRRRCCPPGLLSSVFCPCVRLMLHVRAHAAVVGCRTLPHGTSNHFQGYFSELQIQQIRMLVQHWYGGTCGACADMTSCTCRGQISAPTLSKTQLSCCGFVLHHCEPHGMATPLSPVRCNLN